MRTYKIQENFTNQIAKGIHTEQWLIGAFKAALLAKEGTFIDVGANIGQTLMKMLYLDPDREYVGFEPQVNCCFFIEKFLTQNNLTRDMIFPVGLSNKTGIVRLLKRHDGPDDTASTIDGFRPDNFYAIKQAVYVTRGDDVLSEIGLPQISTIKIDVEGGELEVIEGLLDTLGKHTPFVFFEVLNHFLVVTGRELDAETIRFRENRTLRLEEILRSLGYSIFNILPNNVAVEISKIKSIVSGDLRITDYIAVHHRYRSGFIDNFQGTVQILERQASE